MAKKQGSCKHDMAEKQTESMKDRFYSEVNPKKKKREHIPKPLTEELKKKLVKEMEEARKQTGR